MKIKKINQDRENDTFRNWEIRGEQILKEKDQQQFKIGDWIIEGEKFKATYQKALKKYEKSYGSLRNYASIARRFPMSRRRDNLPYSTYVELLKYPEVVANQWLETLSKKPLSIRNLRIELKKQNNNFKNGESEDVLTKIRKNVASLNQLLPELKINRADSERLKEVEVSIGPILIFCEEFKKRINQVKGDIL